MPISDQVIELETKKKGRNVIFIVLIALLAAASVAFAVLWVTKAPAVDPPEIDKISIAYTDMSQTGTDTSDNAIYTVTSTSTYTIEFDIVLKEGTEVTDVNSLIDVISQPSGAISAVSGGGLIDPENPTRYKYNFKINTTRDSFDVVASSVYNSDVKVVFKLIVNDGIHTETFDLGSDESGAKTLYNFNTGDSVITLSKDDAKSDESLLYYKGDSYLTFYADPLTASNFPHRIDLLQLGELGLNGEYAKVASTGGADEVKLEVGTGSSYDTAAFSAVTPGAGIVRTQTMDFYYGTAFMGNYCSTSLIFKPSVAAERVFLRLTANVSNTATVNPQIVIELQVLSTNDLDKITEIVFTDPYTGETTSSGTSSGTLYLYATGSAIDFDLADCITVKRGAADAEEAEFGTYGLVVSKRTKDNVISLNGASKLVTLDSTKTGADTIVITDKEVGNLGVYLELTVRVCAALDAFEYLETAGGEISGTEYTVNMASGAKISVPYQFNVTMLKSDVELDSLKFNSELSVEYPKGITPVTVAKDNSIYITSIDVDTRQNATLDPEFTRKAANSSYVTGAIEFTVGKNVESSDGYIFKFTLAPQGLNKEALTFTVKLVVTQHATSFEIIEKNDFENPDSYTQVEVKGENRATLTLAIGSVTSGKTNFSIKDILQFYVDETPTPDSQGLNYGVLEFSYAGGNVSDIFNVQDGTFVVPTGVSSVPTADFVELVIKLADFTYRLSIKYYQPVLGVKFDNSPSETDIVYSGSVATDMGNAKNDDITAVSCNGSTIDSVKYVSDASLFNVDLFAVTNVNGSPKALLLPKKQFDSGMSYYYFLPDADLSKVTADDALFRMSYNGDIMTNHSVTLMADLYALSVSNGINLQYIRVYYSYGETENIFNLADTEKGKSLVSYDTTFAVFSEYHFVRKYDGVKLFSDLTYETEIESSILTYPNGSTFVVAGSGYVNLPNGKIDVVEKTALNTNLYLKTVGLDLEYSESHLTLRNGSFTASLADGEGDTATITYTDIDNPLHKASVEIEISNDALGIDSVKLYADANHSTEFKNAVLYKNEGKANSVTVYYVVTYLSCQNGSYSSFEPFAFDYSMDTFNVSFIPPEFKNSPADYELNKTLGYSCTNFVYVYEGSVTFTLVPPAEIGNEQIVVKGGISGGKAFATIKVTSLINAVNATVNVNGTDVVLTADSKTIATKEIQFKYAVPDTDFADKSNAYDFMFAFDGVYDYSILEFTYELSSGLSDKGVRCELLCDSSNNVIGVRLIFGNYRIVGGRFTFNVAETDPADNNVNNYKFVIDFGVDVPVTELKVNVGDKTFTFDDGNKEFSLNFVSTGNGEEATYNLTCVINGGEEHLQPISGVKYELVKDNATDSTFTLSGNTLTFKNTLSATPTALKITVGDFTAVVHLTITVDKYEIEFTNPSAIPDDITSDSPVDFGAKVVNAGTSEELEGATVKYSYERIYGDFTATVDNSGMFKLTSGGYGMVMVIAEYTYAGGTVTVTKTLNVNVPLSDTVELIGGDSAQVSSLNLTVGQAGTAFGVKVKYGVAALGYATLDLSKLSVTSSNPSVAGLSVSGSTVTVLPIASGSATITVNYNGNTASINVTVSEVKLPTLGLTTTVNELDVLTNSLSASLQIISDEPDKITLSAPTADNSALFTISPSGTNYTLTVNKSKVTAASLGKHVITVTATVKDSGEKLTSTVEITLTAGNYTPAIVIKQGNSEVEQIDRANASVYTFNVSNLPTGFGESASVVFASNAFNLNNAGNAATIIGVNNVGGERDTVTVTVTLFGNVYVNTYTYAVVDNGTLTSSVYYLDSAVSDLTALITANGTVSSSLKSIGANGLAIDFDNATAQKAIILITEYTYAPMATLNADRKSFNVATPATLTLTDYDVVVKGDKYYYIAQYSADKAGDVTFNVSTASLNGKSYSADAVSAKLNATAPNFSLNSTAIQVYPGKDNSILQVNSAVGFKGDVTYAFNLTGDNGLLKWEYVQNSLSEVRITADTGVTSGCNATMSVTVTVTSGAFKGSEYTFNATVTLAAYSEPAFEVSDSDLTLSRDTQYDLSDYYTVTSDNLDESFAYELNFFGAVNGTLSGNKTSQKETVTNYLYKTSAANGSVDTVYYTFKVTAGYFVGKEITGSIKITVPAEDKPEVTLNETKTENGGSVKVNGTDGYTTKIEYEVIGSGIVLNKENGTYTFNKTAEAQTAVIKVTVTITSGVFSGEKFVLKTDAINVTAADKPVVTLAETTNQNGGKITPSITDGYTATYKYDVIGNGVTVDENGNYTITVSTVEQTAVIKVTATVSGAPYDNTEIVVYSRTITVRGEDEPTLNATDDNSGTVTVSIENASIMYSVVNGGEYVNITETEGGFTYTFNAGAYGKDIKVLISATVTSGAYSGYTFTKQVTLTAPAEINPTATVDSDNKQIKVSDSVNVSVEYSVTYGGEYVTVNNGGSYEFTALANNSVVAHTAVITVTFTVSGGLYNGCVYERTVKVVTEPAEEPEITANDNGSGTVTVSIENATILYSVVNGGAYVNITATANGFTYTFNAGAYGKDIKVLISATVTSGAYSGYTFTKQVTLTAPAEINPTVAVDSDNKLITVSELENVTVEFAVTYGGEYVTVNNVGSYEFTALANNSVVAHTAVITVTFTVSGGLYNGCVYERTVKVVTVPAETDTDNEGGDNLGGNEGNEGSEIGGENEGGEQTPEVTE